MKPQFRITFAVALLLAGVVECLVTGAIAQSTSSLSYSMDAKEARAAAAQLEHRKATVAYAIANFEKAVYDRNVPGCQRQLDNSAALSVNGDPVTSCKDLLDRRGATSVGQQKLKLCREVVEITEAGARVTVDVMPGDQHDFLTLRQSKDQWLVTSLTSRVIETTERRNARTLGKSKS
jgi:hypothetical protein